MSQGQDCGLSPVDGAITEAVQKELDGLPDDIRHLVEAELPRQFHSGSIDEVRTLADRITRSSMG